MLSASRPACTRPTIIAAAALLLCTVPAGPTQAAAVSLDKAVHRAATAPITATDTGNDVRIYKRAKGLTNGERRSIDIRSISITDRGNSIRLAVVVRDVIQDPDFDQMAFFAFAPTQPDDSRFVSQVGFSTQPRASTYAYAFYSSDDDGDSPASCDPLTSKVRPGRNTFFVDVPKKCFVPEETTLTVTTHTGGFRGDALPTWSTDTLTLPAPVSLR